MGFKYTIHDDYAPGPQGSNYSEHPATNLKPTM
jgi:hypothetical protein